MCLFPRLIKNRKYVKNKKNGGNVPVPKDMRCLYVPVGCGNCIECTKKKGRQWQVRLHEEIKTSRNGKFITLTFSNESLRKLGEDVKKISGSLDGYDYDNEIARLAVRRFLERWRRKFGKSVRHWLVTELGQTNTERIHLHGLLFTDENIDVIRERWSYGHVDVGQYVNEKTINYIVKYVSKTDRLHKEYRSRIFCSHGIGKNYTKTEDAKRNRYREDGGTIETYRTRSGVQIGLPIYYRNKLYTEDEREKLWIEKLDKNVRWVLGVQVDVSNGDDDYYKMLDTARTKNIRLGYGSHKINWDRRRYERERRRMLRGKNLGQ